MQFCSQQALEGLPTVALPPCACSSSHLPLTIFILPLPPTQQEEEARLKAGSLKALAFAVLKEAGTGGLATTAIMAGIKEKGDKEWPESTYNRLIGVRALAGGWLGGRRGRGGKRHIGGRGGVSAGAGAGHQSGVGIVAGVRGWVDSGVHPLNTEWPIRG